MPVGRTGIPPMLPCPYPFSHSFCHVLLSLGNQFNSIQNSIQLCIPECVKPYEDIASVLMNVFMIMAYFPISQMAL